MQAYLTLTRRELGAFLFSATGYVILAIVMFLLGLSFKQLLDALQTEATPVPITELFYQTLYFWVILLITAPLITMRSFAQEKFSGTFETLMTAPVGDLQVVLAKFTAALVFFLVMWLPLLAYILILRRYTNEPGTMDWGTLGGTFVGITLLGGTFMSLGCFASALTRSQMIAAIISFLFGTAMFILSFMAELLPPQASALSTALNYLSMLEHMRDFARGVVDTRPVILYGTLTVLFLFLTTRVVESRRWK